jgi:hypothetical protein
MQINRSGARPIFASAHNRVPQYPSMSQVHGALPQWWAGRIDHARIAASVNYGLAAPRDANVLIVLSNDAEGGPPRP